MDDTIIFKLKPIGLMICVGVPMNDMMAIYDDAPPWPTDEYMTAPIKINKAVNKSLRVK